MAKSEMQKSLEQMSHAELVAEVIRLRSAPGADTADATRLTHELDVHKEELLRQFDQLRATQDLLETSRDEYAALYDFAPVSYLTLDEAGLVLSINLTACTLLQVGRKRVIGLPLSGYVEPAHRPQFHDHMRRCRLATTENVTTELNLRTSQGVSIPVLLVSRRAADATFRTIAFHRTEELRLDQALRDVNATLEDRVTQRTEELQRTNERLTAEIEHRQKAEAALMDSHRRKDEFLAMLGHELRNPLSPIRNGAAVVKLLGKDNPDLVQISDVIERQVHHMARVVDDLLDVSRITRGKIRLLKKPMGLTNVVKQVISDFGPMIEERHLILATEMFPRELWVEGDAVRLAQVVGNLLHNACKFTQSGGTITVRLEFLRNSDEAQLSIHDTGAGIDPDALPHLFVPFHQAKCTLDRSAGGLGLGLALVRGLVELHGGHVQATSPGEGQGSVFTIRLPLIPPPAKLEPEKKSPEASVKSYRILVIDDQRDTVLTLQRVLSGLGHEVVAAVNGEEGIRLARQTHPQIIFSDIGLPGMSGYDVARAVRSDSEIDPLLLVAVTGYGREEEMAEAFAAGFDRHLVKPVAFSEVTKLLHTI